MRIHIVPSLAQPVGALWKRVQQHYVGHGNGVFHIASPLSSTPLPIYRWLIKNSSALPYWENVTFVLMDEQLDGGAAPFRYVCRDDPASYEGFAYRHLLDPLAKETGVVVPVVKPNPMAINDFMIDIHLLILALGVNGNYANVMPGTREDVGWHVSQLTPEFREAHTHADSQSYAGAGFREYGMSLGPEQVLHAHHIAIVISGAHKHDDARRLFDVDSFVPTFPLSIIHHPRARDRVDVFITEDVGMTTHPRLDRR
jgi:6-phosphogluconolactonase/glucosamine-6-phosphate isomerase/deaminase